MSKMPEKSRTASCASEVSELSNSVFTENSTDLYPSSSDDEDTANQHRSLADLGFPPISSQSTESGVSSTSTKLRETYQSFHTNYLGTSEQQNVPYKFHRHLQETHEDNGQHHNEIDKLPSGPGEFFQYREYSKRRWSSTRSISESSKSDIGVEDDCKPNSQGRVKTMTDLFDTKLNGHVVHQEDVSRDNGRGFGAECTVRSSASGTNNKKAGNSGQASGYLKYYSTRKSIDSSSRISDLSIRSRSDIGELVERSYSTILSSGRSSRPRLSTAFLSGRFTPQPVVKKFKVILLGDPGVGKSTFLKTLAKDQSLPSDVSPALFSDHATISTEFAGQKIDLDIQDTAGQERFRSLTASYYRYAQGCLLFFNVHHKESFQNITSWIEDINMYNSQNHALSVVLVGMLHGPPRKSPIKKSNSRRGESSILTSPISTGLKSSNYNNNNNNNNNNNDSLDKNDGIIMARSSQQRRGSLQLLKQEHNQHDYHLSSYQHHLYRTSSVESTDDSREVPKQQAEHMASVWGVPYKEVDAKTNYDSVMDAVQMLLGLVLESAVEQSRHSVDTIRPGGTKYNIGRGSVHSSGRVSTNPCCFHC